MQDEKDPRLTEQDVINAVASTEAISIPEPELPSPAQEKAEKVEVIEEPFICVNCKHYWQMLRTADVQQTALDGELVAGHVLKQTDRRCIKTPAYVLELRNVGIYECNKFEPIEPSKE